VIEQGKGTDMSADEIDSPEEVIDQGSGWLNPTHSRVRADAAPSTREATARDTVRPPAPPTPMSRLRHAIKPGGRSNRHAGIAIAGVGAAGIFLYMLYAAPSGTLSTDGRRQTTAAAQNTNTRLTGTRILTSGAPADSTLGPPGAMTNSASGAPQPSPQPSPFSAPLNYQPYSAVPPLPPQRHGSQQRVASSTGQAVNAFAFDANSSFATPLGGESSTLVATDGNRGVPPAETTRPFEEVAIAPKANDSTEADTADGLKVDAQMVRRLTRLPRGTRIRMSLTEPAASGIASFVRVRVVEAVKDEGGAVLIPAGTEGELPFAGGEYYSRLALDKRQVGFLRIRGHEIPLHGSIKGADGRPGVRGEVKQQRSGPNIFGRAARSVARGIAGSLGGIGSSAVFEAEQAINERGDSMMNDQREVVVRVGTEFVFVVGL